MGSSSSHLELPPVEDTRADATLFVTLMREGGFLGKVAWVSDGVQAIDYIFGLGQFSSPSTPGVILLDLNLPKISGIEVLERLSVDPRAKKIPVIVLTTSARKEDFKSCFMNGAATVFTKPNDLRELRQMVQDLQSVEFPRLGLEESISPPQEDEASR